MNDKLIDTKTQLQAAMTVLIEDKPAYESYKHANKFIRQYLKRHVEQRSNEAQGNDIIPIGKHELLFSWEQIPGEVVEPDNKPKIKKATIKIKYEIK